MSCGTCGIEGCRPTDYAGWAFVAGKLFCRSCSAMFPRWMRKSA